MTQNLEGAFHAIISRHAARYPHWRVDDLYKLVFQAAMGSEHAVSDPEAAMGRLSSEAAGLGLDSDLPIIMPLSPDGKLVRVNLGPYLAAGGHLRELAQVFVQTSRLFKPSLDRLLRYWSWAEGLAAIKDIAIPLPVLQHYVDKQRRLRYPAVHHSAIFRRKYGPAYRVVLKAQMALLLQFDDLPSDP